MIPVHREAPDVARADQGSTRVCVVTTVHPPTDTRIFYRECKTLAAAGYEVILLAPGADGRSSEGIEQIDLRRWRSRLLRLALGQPLVFASSMRQRADVYHLQDPELAPLGLVLKLLGKRVILDVHEDVPQQILAKSWIPRAIRPCLSRTYGGLERFAVRCFDATIAATQPIADRLRGRQTIVVRNYPILSMFSAPAVKEDDFTAIYVGGLSEERGLWEMIEAVEGLRLPSGRRVRLRLVGPVHSESLRRRLLERNREGPVEWVGVVEPEQVYQYLARAHVGLVCLHPVPRFIEALPVKLFEYMAAGLPVIASDFPAWKEILEAGQCGMTVDPLDAGALAEAIAFLVDHPEVCDGQGLRARRAAEAEYNWDKEARKLIDVYERVLS